MEKRRFSLNRERAAEKRGGNKDFRGFEVGANYLRILPPWSEAGDPLKEIHQWWIPAPISSGCYNFERMGLTDDCPVGRAQLDVRRELGDADAFATEFDTRISYLANALFYGKEKGSQGIGGVPGLVLDREEPFVARLSYTVAMAVYEMIMDDDKQPPICDPEQGRILKVTKPKSFKGKANYTVEIVGDPHPFGEDEEQMDRIWDSLHDLDKKTAPTPRNLQRAEALADRVYVEVLKRQPPRKAGAVSPSVVSPEPTVTRTTHEAVSTPSGTSAPDSGGTSLPPAEETPNESPTTGGGYESPKPPCFKHHPPSASCPSGGLEPHADLKKDCQICPWEYHCEDASKKAMA